MPRRPESAEVELAFRCHEVLWYQSQTTRCKFPQKAHNVRITDMAYAEGSTGLALAHFDREAEHGLPILHLAVLGVVL